MINIIKEWTDGDLQCCIEKQSNDCFVYAEVRMLSPNEYVYCSDIVSLSEYDEETLENIVSSWYKGGLKEVKETYKDKANQIIAECVFENTALMEMMSTFGVYDSEDEAVKALEMYVKNY